MMRGLTAKAALSSQRPKAFLVAASMLALAACGTQVPHDEVVAANGGLTSAGASAAGAGTVTGDGTVADGTTTDGGAPAAGTTTDGGAPAAGTTTDGGAPAAGTTTDGGTPAAGTSAGNGSTTPAGAGSGAKAGAAAGSGGAPGNVITAKCSGTGSGTIKVGSSGPWGATGSMGDGEIRGAMQSWASWVNSNGGICGRKVQVIILDDANSASKVSANYKQLVEVEKVAAVVNATTFSNASAFVPYLESKQMPIVGGDQAIGDWFKSSIFFPVGSSVGEGQVAAYKMLQAEPNGSKVAFLYCGEVAACADQYNSQVKNKIPEIAGSKIVYGKQISLTQISFASECQAAQKAGAGVILAYGDPNLMGRVANSCAQQGIKMAYLTVTSDDSMTSNDNLNGHTYATFRSQAWLATNTPGSMFYHQVLAKAGAPLTQGTMNYFVSMLMLQQAITAIGAGEVTPASVLASLRTNVKGFTAGGLFGPTTYRNGAQDQGQCTGSVVIKDHKWTPFNGGNLVCRKGTPPPLT